VLRGKGNTDNVSSASSAQKSLRSPARSTAWRCPRQHQKGARGPMGQGQGGQGRGRGTPEGQMGWGWGERAGEADAEGSSRSSSGRFSGNEIWGGARAQ